MAPPERSRRRRHGKSPRNKRFGSGKSTPSSPAGTPTRHPHTQKCSDLAGASSNGSSLEAQLQTLSESSFSVEQLQSGEIFPIDSSTPLEAVSNASTSGIGEQHLASLKAINEEAGVLKSDKKQDFAMAGELNKLDHLCGLLENIVVAHKDSATLGVKDSIPQKKKQEAQDVKSSSAAEASGPSIARPEKEKSREEIELERKARKDAKKAKKKGSNKENEKDCTVAVNENKPQENDNALKEIQKIQKPPATAGAHQSQGQTQNKKLPADSNASEAIGTGKSKADLKRERREKQEAQRKAKVEAKAQQEAEKKQKQQTQQGSKDKTTSLPLAKKKTDAEGRKGRDKKSADKELNERRIPLLGHLSVHSSQPPVHPVNSDVIHPAIRTLGIKMKERIIDGSTARVISMLAAFKMVINDYQTPESCDLSRDLSEKLLPNVTFLNACRPQNIPMDNAIRFLKHKVNSIDPSVPEAQAKDQLRTAIDDYIRENIILASSTIASHAAQVINDGDVILTFGYSALVSDVVEAACNRGEKVSVVVADTPHPPSGAAMAKRLAGLGVTTYYRLITEVSHIMNKVTKVIVEAEAVMMNGAVQGLCGTAGLALAAAIHDTPFIVLCHTYKFCNNDLTDSLVLNELGDVDCVVSCPSHDYCNLLSDWRETPNLNVVSLVYDVTPANLVTALITEQNVLPTSAVPVIIRRNYADILGQD